MYNANDEYNTIAINSQTSFFQIYGTHITFKYRLQTIGIARVQRR